MNRLEYDGLSAAQKFALSNPYAPRQCLLRVTVLGEEAAISVSVADAAKGEAKRTFRRQQQRVAMARLHSKLSPEEKDMRAENETESLSGNGVPT